MNPKVFVLAIKALNFEMKIEMRDLRKKKHSNHRNFARSSKY
jgi:hypothetical protein